MFPKKVGGKLQKGSTILLKRFYPNGKRVGGNSGEDGWIFPHVIKQPDNTLITRLLV